MTQMNTRRPFLIPFEYATRTQQTSKQELCSHDYTTTMSSLTIASSLRIIMQGQCERQVETQCLSEA